MMKHYKKKYEEEFTSILRDGIEYDANADNVIQDAEKRVTHTRRLVR